VKKGISPIITWHNGTYPLFFLTRVGAQTILNLRVVLLSGLWDHVYQAAVNAYQPLFLRAPADSIAKCRTNAA
jgi:hypothetical protein